MKGYLQHFKLNQEESNRRNGSIDTRSSIEYYTFRQIYDIESFKKSENTEKKPFLHEFCQTSTFTTFIERKYLDPKNPEITFFEEGFLDPVN